MAGILPGVEMHRRIRAASQRLHEDSTTICSAHRHHRFYRSSAEPPPHPEAAAERGGAAAMDEAALRARRRLEEKLGSFRNPRHNRVEEKEGQTAKTKDNSSHSLSRILLGKKWKSHSKKSKSSEGEVCSVCLEDFGSKQQMMELNCTHKYHSECLLPWLASHPNCPSCRTPVGH